MRLPPATDGSYLRLPCHTCQQISVTPTRDLLVLVGLDGLPCIIEGWCSHCEECIDQPVTDRGAYELLMVGISAELMGKG